jgi:hypothetical protein
MDIQIDSREHQHVLTKIYDAFDRRGVNYFCSKLYVGDYMELTNPKVIIDRKQNLNELCGNVSIAQHERFRAEIERANAVGIHLIFLCEHGHGIRNLADVAGWTNPRALERRKIDGRWQTVAQKVMQGPTLCKILMTMERKYGVQFLFCDKDETGDRIIDLLSERRNI